MNSFKDLALGFPKVTMFISIISIVLCGFALLSDSNILISVYFSDSYPMFIHQSSQWEFILRRKELLLSIDHIFILFFNFDFKLKKNIIREIQYTLIKRKQLK